MNIIYGPITETLHEDPMTMIIRVKKRNKQADKNVIKAVKKHKGLKVRFWGTSPFCEFYFGHISKGSALLEILKTYKISRQYFISFGDAENDKEMLELATHGFVMKNAETPIKKYGKYITKKDHHHDGIVDELQRYFKRLSSDK
jgi:hypothetical protein